MSRQIARLSAALITAALVLSATPASAHVSVSSPDATAGGFGKLLFRVPSESETAATTKVRITLPEDTPFAFVSAQPKPGWRLDVREAELAEPITAHGTTLTKAVRSVTWTSTARGIGPGEFDEFALSAGPFPKVRSMSFNAVQTYGDGEVVRWNEPQEGTTEPEHPAPTLELAASTDTAAAESGDITARWLAGAALACALVAVLVALRRAPRRA